MRPIGVRGIAFLVMATTATPAWSGDAPLNVDNAIPPLTGAPPAAVARPAMPMLVPQRRTLDPVACASLCRLFEFLGSLERRKPVDSVPTS
jgi:hypothetical protein